MKIFVNTDKTPPSVVADAQGLQLVSSFEFKRATTVVFDIVIPETVAADIVKLRYGLKLKGKYDVLPVVSIETTDKPQPVEKGSLYSIKATFSAFAIDEALRVDGDPDNDIERADFISEFAWENAQREVTATKTIPTRIYNDVIRGEKAPPYDASQRAAKLTAGEGLVFSRSPTGTVMRQPKFFYCFCVPVFFAEKSFPWCFDTVFTD